MTVIYIIKSDNEFFINEHLRSLFVYLLENKNLKLIFKKVIVSSKLNLENTAKSSLWKYLFENNFPNIGFEFHKDYFDNLIFEQSPDLYYFIVNCDYVISCNHNFLSEMIDRYNSKPNKYLVNSKFNSIFLNSDWIYSLKNMKPHETDIDDFYSNVFSYTSIRSKNVVAMHVSHFTIRGSEIALYDYACYTNMLLDHVVCIVVPKNHKEHVHPNSGLTYDESIHNKFLKSFCVYEYTDLDETLKEINADIFYVLKSGEKDHLVASNIFNAIHCIFQCDENNKHGNIYASICNNINKCKAPVIPHICHSLPKIEEKLFKSDSKYVFGCYGGYESFDIEFVQNTIKKVVETRDDISFIFMNIKKFIDSPLVKFFDKMTNVIDKSKFINSCDAMIHGRSIGESFGISIAEFTTLQKPIITWKHDGDTNPNEDLHHINVLQETGIYYKNEEDLFEIFINFDKFRTIPINYSEIFTPQVVMNKFNEHFIQSFNRPTLNLKDHTENPITKYKLKILCNWTSTTQIHKKWQKLIGDYPVEYTEEKPDYWVIINKPDKNTYYDKNKTIVLGMEPDTFSGERWDWYGDKNCYLYFMDEKYRSNTEWWLSNNLKELENLSPIKTKDTIVSSIVSSQYIYEGHKLRINFLKEAEKELDFEIFGWDNSHNLTSYLTRLDNFKNDGLFPYKYTFVAENVSKENFFTEKFVDAILSECLIFYWGCTNIDSFFNPLCYVKLDLHDITNSIRKIRQTVMNNEWEKRIDIIRKMKKLILTKYSFIPRILGLIKINELEKRTINLKNRPEKWETHKNLCILNQLHNVKRFEAIEGNKCDLNILNIPFTLTNNFVGQNKNTGAIIGCALSHYKLWEETVKLNKNMLIMEDDVTFCDQFIDRLGNVLENVRDVLFLGFHDHEFNLNHNNLSKDFLTTNYRKYDVISFDELRKYSSPGDSCGLSGGGTFGYLLSPSGAQKLINYVRKYSFYFPVDYFIMECGIRYGLNIDFTPNRMFKSPKFGYDTFISDIQQK
jgi:GR25 family glycosyltransferase involved in LPS biosynthesis